VVICFNIGDIFDTYELLIKCGQEDNNVKNFIRDNDVEWNLLFDKINKIKNISEIDILNAKLKVCDEKLRIQDKLHQIALDMKDLEMKKERKFWLIGLGSFLSISGIPYYSMAWKTLSTVQQVLIVASASSLVITTIKNIEQNVNIHKMIQRLRENSQYFNSELFT